MEKQVKLRNETISVDLNGDYYGSEFWDKISNRVYEPDTVAFLEDNCDSSTDFLDIGAANGAITLIAASSGAKVTSYEPDPRIFAVLKRNVDLNINLSKSITLKNVALSSESGILNFIKGEKSDVISSIVFTGHDTTSSKKIEILSLMSEVEAIHTDISRKLLLKMDIEGAEWKILSSESTLAVLRKHRAKMLLAVHPGFQRPFVKRIRGVDRIRFEIWQYLNRRESVRIFRSIIKYGEIRRTNLNPIGTAKQFTSLVQAGYHEFVIQFE